MTKDELQKLILEKTERLELAEKNKLQKNKSAWEIQYWSREADKSACELQGLQKQLTALSGNNKE